VTNAELIAEARSKHRSPYIIERLADALEEIQQRLNNFIELDQRFGIDTMREQLQESRAEAASLREELRKTKESRNAGGR